MRVPRFLPALLGGTLLLLSPARLLGRADDHLPRGVQVGTVDGWTDSLVWNPSAANVQVIVAPAIGGRIVWYGPTNYNILFEQPGSEGKTLASERKWFMVGGYQLDLGPESRGIPAHLPLWLGPYNWKAVGRDALQVTSGLDSSVGMQLEKEIRLDAKTGVLALAQRMKNLSAGPSTFCLWDRTLCKPGGFLLFPLSHKSRFRVGWGIHRTIDGKDTFDTAAPDSPSVQVMNGVLVAQAEGQGSRLGADSDGGWVAYALGKWLFIKLFAYTPHGAYTDDGCSIEAFFSDSAAELEPLAPQVKLKPRQEATFPEKWVLLPLDEEVTSFEQARALVPKITVLRDKEKP